MEHLNVECDLHSLRRLYSLLLLQSNANKEYVPQAFLLDDNSQFLLKRLLDSATEELLDRQHKVLAQAQFGLPERVSTKVNSVSRGMIAKCPSKAGLTHEVVDSIERIETQLSAFQFCSSRGGDRTRSPCVVEEDYSSSGLPFQRLISEKALMEPTQSYLRSHTTRRTSSVAPSLRSVNNNALVATVGRRYDPTLAVQSHGSSSYDDQIVLATSRPPLPSRPLRSVGSEKPKQSNRTSQTMKPTLLLDQEGTETGTSSESEEQVYSTDQESEEASRETVSTTGSSWETHADSVNESDSSYPSESDDDYDENSQVSDSPPPHKRRDRSKDPAKQRKKATGRLKRFKDKLGKVFHHHHYHHHEHHNKEEQSRKPSAWKHLVKKHLQKDKEKVVEKRMKTEPRGLTTHNKKGGEFHALVKGFMRHHRRHSKNKKQKLQTPKRQGGVKFPKRGQRVKLEKTNYLCNKDQEHDEN